MSVGALLTSLRSSVCSIQNAERVALMCLLDAVGVERSSESLNAFWNSVGPTEVAEEAGS